MSANNAHASDRDAGDLADLGAFYDKFLLRTFRQFKSKTPPASDHSSRLDVDLSEQEAEKLVARTPTTHSEAKESALVRDGYRCMLSGGLHIPYYKTRRKKYLRQDPGPLAITQCAHIFSESTNADLHENIELEYASNAWTIIKMFGYPSIQTELAATKVHSLQNNLTLRDDLHSYFDTLELWLEAVPDVPNCYRIVSTYPLHCIGINDSIVTFVSHREDLPLPNSAYLEIHAACCKVAHMSGASGFYNQLQDDSEFDPSPESPAFASSLQARLEYISDFFPAHRFDDPV